MRGGDAPGSHHRTYGNFLGAVGRRKRIAPLGVAGGKKQKCSGSLNQFENWVDRPPMTAWKRGTNSRLNTCSLIRSLEDSALCLRSFLASP